VEEVLDDLRFGRLEVKSFDQPRTYALERIGRRILASVLTGAQILGASLLLAADRETAAYILFATAALTLSSHAMVEFMRGLRSR
jgi:hypothetical protein